MYGLQGPCLASVVQCCERLSAWDRSKAHLSFVMTLRPRHPFHQVENCNQSTSCCDGYNASAPIPYASCNLACSTVARLRPPYINNIAMRARMFYPIPTPDPGTLSQGGGG